MSRDVITPATTSSPRGRKYVASQCCEVAVIVVHTISAWPSGFAWIRRLYSSERYTSMSPGLRPPGPRSTNVCRCCTSVIRIAPGFVYANAPGRPHAAAHTTATTPAVFALFELIKPVPPSSLDAGLLPMPAVKRRSWETPEMEELELLDWKRRVFSLYAEV